MALFNVKNNSNLESARVAFHLALFQQLGIKTNDEFERFYFETRSKAKIDEFNWWGDLPDLEEWKGDRFLAGIEAFKLQVSTKRWASGLRLFQDDIDDDNIGLTPAAIAELARKAKTHRFRHMMRGIINGFDGTAFPETGNGLAYDGAFFFSTTHATGSNKLTTALSTAALESAELLLESQTSFDLSEPLDIMGTHLIVGPKLASTATKLMTQEYLTGGESNYLKGRYTVVVSPLLRGTYDDYWFLADLSKPIKPMLFKLVDDISTSAVLGDKGGNNDSVPRFQRGEVWFGAEARYNVAPWEFRLIVGSQVA